MKITQQARQLAAEYLTEFGKETPGVIGEIMTGKRDYAPAVRICQFTLDKVSVK